MDVKEIEVLIGDNDRSMVVSLRKSLRGLGFHRIESALDGYTTLMIVKKNPVDLLFLSWDLPKFDGLEVVDQIRKIPRFEGPSIILVTDRADRELVSRAVQLGVKDFLVRPFSEQILQERIQKTLGIQLH